MSGIDTFKLEIVRPGPLHGQLLSRLTSYVGLCDGVEADTFRLPFDHHEIKADLRSLRYFVGIGDSQRVPNDLRADAVERLSQRITDAIAQMRSLQTRFAEASRPVDFKHLRLILGGGELSLVPFELAAVPPGWPGGGGKLSLQPRVPVVITRELRDSSRMELRWNRRPRVLFCTAAPVGYVVPPARAHLLAITRALRPWIDGAKEGTEDLKIEDVVTVLEHASIESIGEATRLAEYTHVHFVTHGARLPTGQDRYGLVLARHHDPAAAEVVDAGTLAGALWTREHQKEPPTMVVLASCDSANQSEIETPGSSLAYELHQAGVPWVVASQMPLTFQGSATMARTLYEGLFMGCDPRRVVNDVRRELARDPDAHDWASVVVYASLPEDFESQVRRFRFKQLHRFIDSAFERLYRDRSDHEIVKREFLKIDRFLELWGAEIPMSLDRNNAEGSEHLGMKGAVAKQKSALMSNAEEAKALLIEAASHYLGAAKAQVGNHWVVVQYLSLCKLLGREWPEGWSELAAFSAGADWDDASNKAWAAGSLLELAMLKGAKVQNRTHRDWASELARCTRPGDFELFSTKRQLRRYCDKSGQFTRLADDDLRKRAAEALESLPE